MLLRPRRLGCSIKRRGDKGSGVSVKCPTAIAEMPTALFAVITALEESVLPYFGLLGVTYKISFCTVFKQSALQCRGKPLSLPSRISVHHNCNDLLLD
jgi:hypothetical protein